jgi:hypothetical protein
MRDITPSYSHGSKSFISGSLSAVNSLDSFIDTFESLVIDSIAEAVEKAETDLKKAATKHPDWPVEVTDGLKVVIDKGQIVYTSDESAAAAVADLEFGNRPSSVIRTTAIKHLTSISNDLSNKISKAVPSA